MPTPPEDLRGITVLAISSGGGHWMQLCRLAAAWDGARLVTACTAEAPPMPGTVLAHHRLRDATRWDRLGLLRQGLQVARLVLAIRPDVVVTTGASVGWWALLWARAVGARTVWIDSLANVQRMSGAGRAARLWAHHWWTQWPHLAQADPPKKPRTQPQCPGSVW